MNIGQRAHRELEVELTTRIRPGERPVPIEQHRPARPEGVDGTFERAGRDQEIEILVRAQVRGWVEVFGEHGSLHDQEGHGAIGQGRNHGIEVGQHPQVGGRPRRVRAFEGRHRLFAHHYPRGTNGSREERDDPMPSGVLRELGELVVAELVEHASSGLGRAIRGADHERGAEGLTALHPYLASSSCDPLPGGGPTSTRSSSTHACASWSRGS